MSYFKKSISVILASVIFSLPCGLSRVYAATGSKSDPIIIDNADHWHEIAKNIQENEDWSKGKYFSLNKNFRIFGSQPLAPSGAEKHKFYGTFNGNGHYVYINAGSTAFGYIGKGANVNGLTVKGKGKMADINEGTIENCISIADTDCGFVRSNHGIIQDCSVEEDAELTTAGIAYDNGSDGQIHRCKVLGMITGSAGAGLVHTNQGIITNCLFLGQTLAKTSSPSISGLVVHNNGLIDCCTTRGKMSGGVYLVSQTSESKSLAKQCTVGKGAHGATYERMFGPGYPSDNIEQCGYEGFNQEDYCDLRTPDIKTREAIITVGLECLEIAMNPLGPEFLIVDMLSERNSVKRDMALGLYAAAYDAFVKAPVELVTWLPGKFDCLKEEMEWIRDKAGIPSRFLEGMAKDPLVFKVSKIGGDIACLFIGVKGAITAVTKAGKLIKIGRTASGIGKVIPVNFRPGLMPVATAGSSALALEAAPQMIIENVEEAKQALGILKTTLMQAGKVAGGGAVAGGGGSSLAHDIGSTSSTTAPQSSTSGGSSEPLEIRIEGRGSTGRTVPVNLKEQIAMKEVKSNPLKDATDLSASGKFVMNDARWPAGEGWVKMSKNVNGVEIHFLYNKIKHVFDDFKFVS